MSPQWKRNKDSNSGKYIKNPEKLVWFILKRHFPFLRGVTERDSSWVDDVNQIGQLCFYATGGDDYKAFYNMAQRELYALAKAFGYRKKDGRTWIRSEERLEDSLARKIGE